MGRIQLPITARDAQGNAISGASVYVYLRGTVSQATGYTTEEGATAISYPLITDADGRCPAAWYPGGSYDVNMPADALNPTVAWDAFDYEQLSDIGVDVASKLDTTTLGASGMGVVEHGVTATVARPTQYLKVTWIGSVEPINAVNGDVWVDTT